MEYIVLYMQVRRYKEMAEKKICRKIPREGVDVQEYVNGQYTTTYTSIAEAAKAHKTVANTIKNCIANGFPLNYEGTDIITFDVPSNSPYSYDYITDANGRKKLELFIDC